MLHNMNLICGYYIFLLNGKNLLIVLVCFRNNLQQRSNDEPDAKFEIVLYSRFVLVYIISTIHL